MQILRVARRHHAAISDRGAGWRGDAGAMADGRSFGGHSQRFAKYGLLHSNGAERLGRLDLAPSGQGGGRRSADEYLGHEIE